MDIVGLLIGFVSQYPVVAVILFVMGALRAVFKPLMAMLRAYVEYTPNPADNLALDKVEASSAYKAVAFVLDYLASIKLPQVR